MNRINTDDRERSNGRGFEGRVGGDRGARHSTGRSDGETGDGTAGSDRLGSSAETREMTDPYEASEHLESLLPLLARHQELDVKTIGYHARQSDATARDGYWHAAIGEARSFLEALVTGIELIERGQSLDEYRKERAMQGGIKPCRRYLHELGFLDLDEVVLLAHVYSIASAKGSHLGTADEAWCRLARRIIHNTSAYLLHRYAAWNKTNRRPQSTRQTSRRSGSHCPSNRSSPRIPWRERLASFLRRAAIRAPGASLVTNDPQSEHRTQAR